MGSPWIVAHIVGMRPAGLLSWLVAIALFGGILGIIVGDRRWRYVWLVISIAGLAGTVYDMVERSQPPARPNLIVRLVSPNSKAEDPIVVRL
ncbi:MAG TPA: hypothetical protein VG815_21125, partial [Chloroflexota bacterium]|nr:hypothetical protein [Chloroflexota bacterium]